MSEFSVKDLEWLFNGGAERRGIVARQMRNDELPAWMEEAFQSMGALRDPTIKENGQKHSVESMTEELKKRVQLDMLTKEAAAQPKTASAKPPLCVKANDHKPNPEADKTMAAMLDYAERHLVRPSHGQSPIAALFEAIKEKFGIDGVSRAGGIARVKEMLEKLKKDHDEPNPAHDLPNYDGATMQVGRENANSKDRSDFLTQDTAPKM